MGWAGVAQHGVTPKKRGPVGPVIVSDLSVDNAGLTWGAQAPQRLHMQRSGACESSNVRWPFLMRMM